ncbi:hypothetical protein [Mesorhizobium sp. WSM2239]|uniref:Uncharacterized protein n=2 Tax=unclassified Mesorhizobium TaxID=325217 RepID=A0AAU8D6V4_9HYPH
MITPSNDTAAAGIQKSSTKFRSDWPHAMLAATALAVVMTVPASAGSAWYLGNAGDPMDEHSVERDAHYDPFLICPDPRRPAKPNGDQCPITYYGHMTNQEEDVR